MGDGTGGDAGGRVCGVVGSTQGAPVWVYLWGIAMTEKRYKFRNWEKYQGRKNRKTNPWLKLHKSIINDPDVLNLSPKLR